MATVLRCPVRVVYKHPLISNQWSTIQSGQFVVLSKLVYSYLSLNQSLYDQTFQIVLFVA